ncbi:MAG: hypothetical protein RL708_413 [Bacteroidota bacterium]|jgi:hypothetical protein
MRSIFFILITLFFIACTANSQNNKHTKPTGYKTPPPHKPYPLNTPTLNFEPTKDSTVIGVWYEPERKGRVVVIDAKFFFSKNYKYYVQNISLYETDSIVIEITIECKKVKIRSNYYLEAEGGLMFGIAIDSNLIQLSLDTTSITGYYTKTASLYQINANRRAYLENCRKNDTNTIGRWVEDGDVMRIYTENNKLYYQFIAPDSVEIDEEINTTEMDNGTKIYFLKCPPLIEKAYKNCDDFYVMLYKDDSTMSFVSKNSKQRQNHFVKIPTSKYLYNISPIDSFFYHPNQNK